MPNIMRYRGGDCQPQIFKTNASYPIQEGDLLVMDATDGTVRPASTLTTQAAVHQRFAGVALGRAGLQPGEFTFNRTMDVGYVMVGTEGTFEFPCPLQQFKPGDFIGIYADANGCQSQKVDIATSAANAIGVAVPGVQSLQNPASTIFVRIKSTITTGGEQAPVTGA